MRSSGRHSSCRSSGFKTLTRVGLVILVSQLAAEASKLELDESTDAGLKAQERQTTLVDVFVTHNRGPLQEEIQRKVFDAALRALLDSLCTGSGLPSPECVTKNESIWPTMMTHHNHMQGTNEIGSMAESLHSASSSSLRHLLQATPGSTPPPSDSQALGGNIGQSNVATGSPPQTPPPPSSPPPPAALSTELSPFPSPPSSAPPALSPPPISVAASPPPPPELSFSSYFLNPPPSGYLLTTSSAINTNNDGLSTASRSDPVSSILSGLNSGSLNFGGAGTGATLNYNPGRKLLA